MWYAWTWFERGKISVQANWASFTTIPGNSCSNMFLLFSSTWDYVNWVVWLNDIIFRFINFARALFSWSLSSEFLDASSHLYIKWVCAIRCVLYVWNGHYDSLLDGAKEKPSKWRETRKMVDYIGWSTDRTLTMADSWPCFLFLYERITILKRIYRNCFSLLRATIRSLVDGI